MVTRTSRLDVLHSTAPRLLQYYNNDVTIHVPGRRSPTFKPGGEIISQWCVFRVGRPSCTWYQLASLFTRHHNPWYPCIGLRQGFSLRYPTDMVHEADQQENRERCNDSWPGYSTTSVELSCPQALRLSYYRRSPPWAPVITCEKVLVWEITLYQNVFRVTTHMFSLERFKYVRWSRQQCKNWELTRQKNAYWDMFPCRKKAIRVCSQCKITGPYQIVRYTYSLERLLILQKKKKKKKKYSSCM